MVNLAKFRALPSGTIVWWGVEEKEVVRRVWSPGPDLVKTIHIQDGLFYLPTGTGHKFKNCRSFNKIIKVPKLKINQFDFGGMLDIFEHFSKVNKVWISSEIESD